MYAHPPFNSLLQISISVQPGAVVREELLTLFQRDFALLNALSNPNFELSNQFFGVILHVVEHLFNRFAVENLVDVVLSILYRHVHGVGIAK